VTNITNSSTPVVFTANTGTLANGDKVGLGGIFEPNELIDNTFIINNVVTNVSFELTGIDTTLFSPFSGTCIWYENPVKFQLNFTVTSQKDVNLQANANSILDKVDWCCFTDRNGQRVIDAIPINNYNAATYVITCDPNYVIPYADWLIFQGLIANQDTFYVITGDYASTHSELDRQSEDLLIEYVVLRLYRLQSAAEPSERQLAAEDAVLGRIAIAYRRYRPSIVPIIYQQRLRSRSWYGNGPRGTGF
jgi:hypothetical protein